MNGLMRRLRGAAGTAVTWAVGWAVVALPFTVVMWLLGGSDLPLMETLGPLTAIAAGSGFVSGGIFSLGLAALGRNRSLEDLNVAPMAALGAAAAVVLPILAFASGLFEYTPLTWQGAAVFTAAMAGLGGATGGGLVKIAKGADAERLTSGE